MMPVPKKRWEIKVQITNDPRARSNEATIKLDLVLPTVNDVIQITDFRYLLRGDYHDSYRVTGIGLEKGKTRMVVTIEPSKEEDVREKRFTTRPAVYPLATGKYVVDIRLDPGGQIAQRKKIPAIPLMGDYFRATEPTAFVSLDDPGFGSGEPQFPFKVEGGTLLRVVGAYHSWSWLNPKILRDGTPRIDVTLVEDPARLPNV
ncbi:MAG: hypothetical protein O7H41_07775 [Planctomycetota bacterium]|nr:hypothetical protein [Planctomycetota bacterium]